MASKDSVTSDSSEEDLDSWYTYCYLCRDAFSKEDMKQMVVCEGYCRRLFHLKCAGMDKVPVTKWLCEWCKADMHACMLCGDNFGNKQHVMKCSMEPCSRTFHLDCIKRAEGLGIVHWRTSTKKYQKGANFICPIHTCWICGEVGNELNDFIQCPLCAITSYHKKCCKRELWDAVGTRDRIRTDFIMYCPNHAKVPSLLGGSMHPYSIDFSKKLVAKIQQQEELLNEEDVLGYMRGVTRNLARIPRTKVQKLSIVNGCVTREAADNSADLFMPWWIYCLPEDIKRNSYYGGDGTDVENITRCEWTLDRKKNCEDFGRCQCTDECNTDCLNYLQHSECHKRNCNLPEEIQATHCYNRALTRHQVPKLKIVDTSNKGKGVVTAVDIPKGMLVAEYVGEVLDEVAHSLRSIKMNFIEASHWYIMDLPTINGRVFIDASQKGNVSRYLNHSCEPNCVCQKWDVKGDVRMGLFAQRDIKANEELTFDYAMEYLGTTKPIPCLCGSSKCRKFIAKGTVAKNALTNQSEATTLFNHAKLQSLVAT